MNLTIDSANFSTEQLKPLLRELHTLFSKMEIEFVIIGATARDIILSQLNIKKRKRATRDLDIAIAIANWDKFSEVKTNLLESKLFKSDPNITHRFMYNQTYELDIIPFGDIATNTGEILWPPEEDISMSIKGLNEVMQSGLNLTVDNEFTVKVATLSGLFILKLRAWLERHESNDKDAGDMYFILNNYYEIFNGTYDKEEYHQEIYDNNFCEINAGAIWLGYDLKGFLSKQLLEEYGNILREEVDKYEESILLQQMLKTSKGHTIDDLKETLSMLLSIILN